MSARVRSIDRDSDAQAAARAGAGPVPDVGQERALDFVHQSALQHVVLADRKAGILFTLLSAALLYLFSSVPAFAWPPSPTAALWLLVVVLLVLATALAFLVILPRVRPGGTRDVLFWGAIARHETPEAYLEAVCGRSAAELARAKAVYCHQLSQICQRKFRLMRWSLLLAGAGLILFLVALAFGLTAGATPAGGA